MSEAADPGDGTGGEYRATLGTFEKRYIGAHVRVIELRHGGEKVFLGARHIAAEISHPRQHQGMDQCTIAGIPTVDLLTCRATADAAKITDDPRPHPSRSKGGAGIVGAALAFIMVTILEPLGGKINAHQLVRQAAIAALQPPYSPFKEG